MTESLEKFDLQLTEIEKSRIGAYEGLSQQVKGLFEAQNVLRNEASNLSRALTSPIVRGSWGQMQLRRVVELAGMMSHCDFVEQDFVMTEEGILRPDMVVKIPGGGNVIVDAKVALSAFMESVEATDEKNRKSKLADHAKQVRSHVDALSKKSYWEQFYPSPEMVVMFIPGDHFVNAAFEQDPDLFEHGIKSRVLIATPGTLIAVLSAYSFAWCQQSIAENANEIRELGLELHKRVSDMAGHLSEVGIKLSKTVESYNKAVGSMETRVLVSTRKFRDYKAVSADDVIEPIEPIDVAIREIQIAQVSESNFLEKGG